MADVYLSYTHKDSERVVPIAKELRKLGLSVWLDQEVSASAHWMEEIERALHESPVLVLFLSQSYLASPWANVEFGVALSRAQSDAARMVPALLEDVDLPPLLRSQMYIDARYSSAAVVAGKINAIVRRSDA